MAYKSTTLYASYGAYYGFSVSFTENSTSTPNNTSNITCSASIWSENRSGWSAGSNSTLTVYWHDNRENYDRYVASISFSSLGVGETKTASGTIDVTHNDNGDLSGYAYAYFGKGGSSAYTPASSGLTTDWTPLTKIDRYATLTSAPNFNDEQNPTITYNVPNKNITSLQARIENSTGSGVIAYVEYRDIDINGTSYTFNFTDAERQHLRELIPNSKTLGVKFVVKTVLGGNTFWSVLDRTMTIINGNPTFDASYLDTNSTTTAITGDNQQIIRNQSLLEIDVSNATAYKYATLSSIKATINGTEYTTILSGSTATFNIGEINVASNTNAVVTLTDSRGFTATQTLELEVLNWELPTAIITLQRENNYYSNTNINVDANYSSIDNHNTITLKTRYKKVTDSSYGSYVTLQDNVTSTLNLDNNYQWDVQVLVQDLLGQTTYNLTLDRGIPIVYFDRLKRSVGVNCFPELDASIELNGHPLGGVITGSIQMYAGSTAPSGWLICDGSAVSRDDYANLFSVIGTTYGAGDGSTTFNIPNLKGRVPVGLDTNDTSFDTLGEAGGSKELQAHNHDIRYNNPNGSGVTISHTGSGLQTLDITNWSWQRNTANSKGSGSNLSTNTEGSGDSGKLQPYLVLNYIIAC